MANAKGPSRALPPIPGRAKRSCHFSRSPSATNAELDPEGIPQFGLVAEKVEKVNPDLVARDEQGKPYTVRYEAVNAMLLNEFLKEHRKVEEQGRVNQEQGTTISELKSALTKQQQDFQSAIAQQQKEIKSLTEQMQRVSNELEASSLGRAPQVVVNNQ